MRSYFVTSALTIALAFSGSIIPAVGEPILTPAATQQQTSEIDKIIQEAESLSVKERAVSRRKAIVLFKKALDLSRSANAYDKQALSLLALGSVYSDLGENQEALDYYNQALPLSRKVGDHKLESNVLNNIGLIYSDLDEQRKALGYYDEALPLSRKVKIVKEKLSP